MEKINVAELLRNCPRGMELDCTICENVYFDYVSELNIIHCYIQYETYRTSIIFNQRGAINSDIKSKCVIFPKGKTTWEGFHRPFKDGDVVAFDSKGGVQLFIFKEYIYNHDYAQCYMMLDCDGEIDFEVGDYYVGRFATEEEKAKLFKSIRDNGYKWDPKTKTLENLFSYNIGKKVWVKSDKEHKYIHTIVGISRNSFGNLEYEVKEETSGVVVHYPETLLIPIVETKEPKFKVGDKIKPIGSDRYYIIKNIEFDRYVLNNNQFLKFTDEHIFELAPNKLVRPKFKVGDRIKHKTHISQGDIITEIKGTHYILNDELELPFIYQDEWELVPNKFDINTLVPFESRVLARDNEREKWIPAFWGFYDVNSDYPYKLIGCIARYCIPYEGNEHLRGKTDDCDKYFKTWK